MNGKSAPGCSSSAPLEVRVAEEHGKQKSAFFTSFVKRRTQYNAHRHDTSKVTVKQGCNSIDIFLGPEPCPSNFLSFETYLNLLCLSTEFSPVS